MRIFSSLYDNPFPIPIYVYSLSPYRFCFLLQTKIKKTLKEEQRDTAAKRIILHSWLTAV